jgi:hypothetical protein
MVVRHKRKNTRKIIKHLKNHMTRKLGVDIISYKNIKSMKKRKSIHSRKSVNKRVKLKRNRRYYKITGGYHKIMRGESGAVVDEQSLKRAVVFEIDSKAGFFWTYRNLLFTYLYAKKINAPFFIEHDNWQYTYKDGWHDYFKSLNVFNKDDQFDLIEFFNIRDTDNTILSKGDVDNERDMRKALKETFILQDSIQASIDEYIKEIGGEYTSLYVRRGDKITERQLVPLDDILAQTTIKDDGRIIFVQTDDYNLVKDMRGRFPSCKIMTLTSETAHGANNMMMLDLTPEQRKKDTEELLISCVVSARANIGWSYYASNVGYFIKLLGHDNIQLYLDAVPSKE